MKLFYKDPDAVLDYAVNWSDYLEDGETLSSSSFTVESGITKDSESNTGTSSVVWLSGGELYAEYTITCTITTSEGRTDERSFSVSIKQL